MANPFDYVESVSSSKKDLIRTADNPEIAAKEYLPFIVNRALSYHSDTIMYCNEMNIHHGLDNDMQYSFYLNSLRKNRRFAKWIKHETLVDLIIVMEYTGYNRHKAIEALSILTKEQLQMMKNHLIKGGNYEVEPK